MRRIFILLILSFSLSFGTGEAFADKHNNGRPRQEQRGSKNNSKPGGNKHPGKDNNKHGHNKGPQGSHGNKNNHGNKNHHGNPSHNRAPYHPGPGSLPAPGRPTPPPPPAPSRPIPPAPVPVPGMLQQMVINTTYGCHDVNVWQVNPESFIVKYRRGNRLYTRMIYPYAGRYGNETLISVNWQPLNPWTLIPPIQLNINL